MLIQEITNSFLRLPKWVQIWVVGCLVPVNMFSLFFLQAPSGAWVAALSVAGMLPNLYIPLVDRGLGKSMALPHVLPWTVQWFLIAYLLLVSSTSLSSPHHAYLWVLWVVNSVSLFFDYQETLAWFRGERQVA